MLDSERQMGVVILTLKMALAMVFAVAAVSKMLDRAGTKQAAQDFGVPPSLVRFTTIVLPVVEALVAAGLLAQPTATAGAFAALALLVIFAAAIARVMRRGEAVECHCFGQLQSAVIGPWTLARNAVLGVVAGIVALAGPGRSLADLGTEDVALFATSVAAVGLGALSARLWRENGRLRARAAAPVSFDRGLPPGSAVPDITLRMLDGEPVALAALVGDGKPAMLVQIGLECGPCHALMPDLVRWNAALSESLTIAIVASGDLEPNLAFAEAYDVPGLLVAEPQEFAAAFEVRSTPSAVLIDVSGRIAAPPALGGPAIQVLVRSVLRSLSALESSTAGGRESLAAPTPHGGG